MSTNLANLKKLRAKLELVEKRFPTGAQWWKYKSKCDFKPVDVQEVLSKKVCENPNILKSYVFDPLYKWLGEYQKLLEGKMAYTGGKLDQFIISGLLPIAKFVAVSEVFSQNPEYILPGSNTDKMKENREKYSQLLTRLNEDLVGCRKNIGLMYLPLIKNVKTALRPGQSKTLKYIDYVCNLVRLERLPPPPIDT